MSNTVLETTKTSLGIPAGVTDFDTTILMLLNSVLVELHDLGFGDSVFQITPTSGELEDYIAIEATRAYVQAYLAAKVRLRFDPPTNQNVLAALERTIAEHEYRLPTMAQR